MFFDSKSISDVSILYLQVTTNLKVKINKKFMVVYFKLDFFEI